MDCPNKLWKDIFHYSILAEMSCGGTKAEAIVNNVLATRSVDVMKDAAKSGNLSSTGTDASSHKDRMIIPSFVGYLAFLMALKASSWTSLNKLMKQLI
jgi:hypothetical protein